MSFAWFTSTRSRWISLVLPSKKPLNFFWFISARSRWVLLDVSNKKSLNFVWLTSTRNRRISLDVSQQEVAEFRLTYLSKKSLNFSGFTSARSEWNLRDLPRQEVSEFPHAAGRKMKDVRWVRRTDIYRKCKDWWHDVLLDRWALITMPVMCRSQTGQGAYLIIIAMFNNLSNPDINVSRVMYSDYFES